jgi:hypothetical protein
MIRKWGLLTRKQKVKNSFEYVLHTVRSLPEIKKKNISRGLHSYRSRSCLLVTLS